MLRIRQRRSVLRRALRSCSRLPVERQHVFVISLVNCDMQHSDVDRVHLPVE
jgi:hypothetical protein